MYRKYTNYTRSGSPSSASTAQPQRSHRTVQAPPSYCAQIQYQASYATPPPFYPGPSQYQAPYAGAPAGNAQQVVSYPSNSQGTPAQTGGAAQPQTQSLIGDVALAHEACKDAERDIAKAERDLQSAYPKRGVPNHKHQLAYQEQEAHMEEARSKWRTCKTRLEAARDQYFATPDDPSRRRYERLAELVVAHGLGEAYIPKIDRKKKVVFAEGGKVWYIN